MAQLRFRHRSSGSGASWDDALSLDALEDALERAAPGDELLVGFDRNREDPVFWDRPLARIREGGSEDDPLRLSFGFIGSEISVVAPNRDGPALFRRSGAGMPTMAAPDTAGEPLLVVSGDASDFVLNGPLYAFAPAAGLLSFELSGRQSRCRNIRIANLSGRMAGRVIETVDGVDIEGLVVEHCSAQGLVRGFARFESLSDAVFRNLDLDAALVDGGGTDVCQIIFVRSGRDIRFEGVTLANAVNAIGAEDRGSTYIQGDGIVCEEDTANVLIRNCHAFNCGDGGFDLKTDGVELIDSSAARCKYGVRIWSDSPANLMDRCVITSPLLSEQNVGSCVWCAGRLTIVDCFLRAGDSADIIRFGQRPEGSRPSVTIVGGNIEHSPESRLVGGEAGELLLHDVRINGELITGRAVWDGDRLQLTRE